MRIVRMVQRLARIGLLALSSLGLPLTAQPCATVSTCAYELLNSRATANQSVFYVYKDADSAFNHGFGSGLFNSTDVNINSVILDPGCIDAPGSADGCSTDPNAIDRTRGTVFRFTFPALANPSSYIGLNFLDPQNYVMGDGSSGYNLSPATAIQFDVRSPGAMKVQFGVGGCVSGFYPVTQTWQTVTIPLDTLYPPPGGSAGVCPPDITATHILFTVTTNAGQQPAGGTILLDNIQFLPVPARQSSDPKALSLPLSTQTFGVIPQTANPIPPDQANRNIAAIYESALTILTFLKRGQGSDIANALQIADTLDYALHHDNHGDPVTPGTDGSMALHNAYMAGDIALLNQQSAQGAQAGDVRLAGFTGGASLCGRTGFCLVLDGATGGNNAWAILGLAAAYLQSGRPYYLTDAETIGAWIINQLQDRSTTSFGGYFVGFNDSGKAGLQQPNKGKSTENNGDIFGAFSLLSQIETALGNTSAAQNWLIAANVAGDFVKSMAITGTSSNGGFYVGTVTAADALMPAAGNCPSAMLPTGNDVINTCEFLDSDTFTVLPMAGALRYSSLDWADALRHVLNYSSSGTTYTQSVTADGQMYQGFDLVPASPSTGVVFEFTGQVSATCSYLDTLESATTFQNCASTYLTQIQTAQASAPFTDGNGLVASVLQNGDRLTPVNQCLSTPFQCIPERVGLAASNWAIIADQTFNPMAYAGALFSVSQVIFPTPQTVGSASSPIVVVLTNAGTAPMSLAGISIGGPNGSDFKESDTCGAASALSPGSVCHITVTFTPVGPGSRTATLSVNSNGIGGMATLAGSGVPVDDFSISVAPVTQSVNAGKSLSYNISTTVTRGAVQSVTLSASGLPAGATASFAANPILSGTATTMRISTSIGATPASTEFTVTGTGTEIFHSTLPNITIQSIFNSSIAAITFASQTTGTTSGAQFVTITNPDTGALPISLLVTGPNSGEFGLINNCPGSLPAMGSCLVTMTFTPAGTGPRSASLLIQSGALPGGWVALSGTGAGACASIGGCAYSLLAQRVNANAGAFYVYKDADSGLNHGTPSNVFGSLGFDTNTVVINSGCVDSPTDPSGCSGDPNAIDITRGAVFSITFPSGLSGSEFAGLNFVEPSDYALGDSSTGYNVTPANSVQLDARAPQGATVRFGVGGCVTPYVTLGPGWTTMTIVLDSLIQPGLPNTPCTPDLTQVHILFAISADYMFTVGGPVLLDNIRFTPVPYRQGTAVSLPFSTQTFGVTPAINYPIPTDQVNRNVATVYESSLSVLALLARGQGQDLANAVTIANALDYALHHDNHGDPIPVAPGGYSALHSAYESGDLPFLNSQAQNVGEAQAGDVRLSGFTASSTLCEITQFCLVLDGATGGNNAWAILALGVAYVHTGNTLYLSDAELIGNWIVATLTDRSVTGYGGYYLGYSDGGLPKVLQVGKSTEQNADIFAAFNLLAQIESARGNSTLASSWAASAKVAGDFVVQMFDLAHGRFNTGTVNNIYTTSPGPGICPSTTQIKGADTVNTCDFLDANTTPILAMSGTATYQAAVPWMGPLQYLSTFAQTVSADGIEYQGFGLVPASPKTGIGWEFTSQAVAAYSTGSNGSATAATYLQQIRAAQNSAPFGDGKGVVGATLQSGDVLAPASQCLNTPFQCIPERIALASSAWAALAERGANPLNPGASVMAIGPQTLNFLVDPGSPTGAQSISITNTGTVSTSISVSLAGANPGDFSVNGCTGTIAAGMSCSVTVTFTPGVAGSDTATLVISQTPVWASQPVVTNVTIAGAAQENVCDIDKNETVDVSDAQRIINEVLGVAAAADDFNGDSVVNVVDAQIMINAALNLGCSVPNGSPALSKPIAPHSQSSGTHAASTAITAGETGRTADSSVVDVQPYKMTDLGTLGGSSAAAHGINNRGQVVGRSATGDTSCGDGLCPITHAFLWEAGQMTDLGFPAGADAIDGVAYGINDAGQVVGVYSKPGYSASFEYTGGTTTALSAPSHASARSINIAGRIAGGPSTTGTTSAVGAFLWDAGTVTDLASLTGAGSQAYGINDIGEIVGVAFVGSGSAGHAFQLSGAGFIDLGTLGGTTSVAFGINNAAQIVGSSQTQGDKSRHAFLYSSGRMTDLGTLGGLDSQADGINGTGLIVGWAMTVSGERHAVLWSSGRILDLSGCVTLEPGTRLEEATAVNDLGQIVANASSGRTFLITLPDQFH